MTVLLIGILAACGLHVTVLKGHGKMAHIAYPMI
jgi:hypothetical protein